jgi:hypothetical protein
LVSSYILNYQYTVVNLFFMTQLIEKVMVALSLNLDTVISNRIVGSEIEPLHYRLQQHKDGEVVERGGDPGQGPTDARRLLMDL